MYAFGLGFGVALASAFAGWMVYLFSLAPTPTRPEAWIAVAIASLLIYVPMGGLGVPWILTALKPRDFRTEFRTADPRGHRSVLAGFATAAITVSLAVGVTILLLQTGTEKDPWVIGGFVFVWLCVAVSPIAGAAAFLSVIRPRIPSGP